MRRPRVCVAAKDEVIFMEVMTPIHDAILDGCDHPVLLSLAQEETRGAVIGRREILRAHALFLSD